MRTVLDSPVRIIAAAALSVLFSAGGAFSAEFEMTDKLAVNGYTLMKSSAEVRGLLGISTGTPYAALDVVSTGTAHTEMAQIWRAGDGVIKGSMSATGYMQAVKFIGDGSGLTGIVAGDDLGNHIATDRLEMSNKAVDNVSSMTITATGVTGSDPLFKVAGSTLVVLNNGYVGIGTASPAEKLHVAGNMNATGSYMIAGSTVVRVSATSSISLGMDAGRVNSGATNAFLGYQAGYSNSSATNGVFAGYYAGRGNTTGVRNTILGASAGYYTDVGSDNTFVGYNSGSGNHAGSYNTYLGSDSGFTTSGSGNTLLGYKTAYRDGGAGTYANTTLLGYKAGYNVRNGSGNIFLGYQAGYSTLDGGSNIVIGYDQGTSAPAASNELNIGGVLFGKLDSKTVGISTRAPQAALDIVSTGTAHTEMAQIWRAGDGVIKGSMSATGVMQAVKFIGDGSGLTGIPGDNLGNHVATTTLDMAGFGLANASTSTFTGYISVTSTVGYAMDGYSVLRSSASRGSVYAGRESGRINAGTNNAYYGDYAGYNATTPNGTFIGSHAGYNNNSSIGDNTYVGFYSGFSTTSGNQNTFLGYRSGYYNSSGEKNVFIGTDAGYSNMTGYGNSLIGYGAGYNNGGNRNVFIGEESGLLSYAGGYNVAVGYRAGLEVEGAYNTFLGHQAGDATTTGSSNIIIGSGQDASSGGASNQLNIGGTLFGDLSAQTIGIRTRYPYAALDIVSTGTTHAEMAQIWRDSGSVIKASMSATGVMMASKFIGDGSGLSNVSGSSPVGSALTSASIWVGDSGNQAAAVAMSGEGSLSNAGAFTLSKSITPTWTGAHIFSAGVTANGAFTLGDGGDTCSVNTSDWGITAAGGMTGISGITSDGAYTQSGTALNTFTGATTVSNSLTASSATVTGAAFSVGGSTFSVSFGKVGVGTSSPGVKFEVVGNSGANDPLARFGTSGVSDSNSVFLRNGSGDLSFFISGAANNFMPGTTAGDGGIRVTAGKKFFIGDSGAARMALDSSGRVGIGTAYPAMPLQVVSNTDVQPLNVSGTNTNAIGMGIINSVSGSKGWLFSVAGSAHADGVPNGSFIFRQTTDDINAMVISTAGYVGIGAINPVARLEVAGQVKITGGSPGSGKVLTSDAAGLASWGTASGDNLGDHTATMRLNMAGNQIIAVSSLTITGAPGNTHALQAGANGILISTGGAITTTGIGHGTVVGNARGLSAVDLQTFRTVAGQVASGSYSVISGGGVNTASGALSTVSGGTTNTAVGIYSVVPGGAANNASGLASWAGGYGASSTADGSFTWADSKGVPTSNNVVNRTLFKSAGGFMVTGSTNTAMSGNLNRGMLVTGNGLVGISTGIPYAALDVVSTGTAHAEMAQIWRASDGVIKGSMSATGVMMASKFVGDGSGLTGITAGDDLGDHVATTTLQMGAYGINTSSDITAARYQINGSTMVAILPGTASIAYGVNAGSSNITGGNYNTFIGNQAGASNTTADYNTAGGYKALYSNTSGYGNTVSGAYSLTSNIGGYRNIAIGYSSGYSNTSGSYNAYIGVYAGHFNTAAWNNSLVGYSAGYYNETGSSNSIIGFKAGYGVSGNSYVGNTIVGYQAGYGLTTGSDNIFLGWQAGYDVTTGTGNIVIGYNIGTSGATANNEINIGNVYKGNVSSGTAQIPKVAVQAADAGITLTSADFGKTITVNSASNQTVTLPAVTAADIGATITVVKLGAANVTVDAPAGVYIADSSSGGTILNNLASQTYATITLRLVTSTRWVILWGDGCWTTT